MIDIYLILCITAALGGAINAVAGGGTLLTFPALYAALGPGGAVVANGTSTVALLPSAFSAIWGYRRELAPVRRWAWLLVGPSLAGGLLGAVLVIARPDSFKSAVPWLILTAALLFALQPAFTKWTGIGEPRSEISPGTRWGVAVFQFFIAVYGGYFGAGIGILMLSALALMGLSDIHQMNALKSLLNAVINGISVVVFISDGVVHWPFAAAMAASSVVGGYVGARVARRLDRRLVRGLVVTIGLSLAAYYFYREWRVSSNKKMPAATATFSESTPGRMAMVTRRSHKSIH